ncbi:hypothetical protein ABW20_dc0100715 [Dactylellina cionopaga]|nr:hypothetical protein ABW20_dc0100715 [Dactylellina cionopaga]
MYVPLDGFKAYRDIISKRLKTAQIACDDYYHLESKINLDGVAKNLEKSIESSAQDLKKFVADATEQRKGDLGAARTAVIECANNLALKKKKMEIARDGLVAVQATFETSLKDYAKAKEKEAQDQLIKDVFQCIVAVGAAIATAGASAPATLKDIKNLVDGVEKAVTIWDHLKKVAKVLAKIIVELKKANEMYKRSEKTRQAIYKVQASYYGGAANQRSTSATTKELTLSNVKDLMPDMATTTFDYLGLKAQWSEFAIDVDTLFNKVISSQLNPPVTCSPKGVAGLRRMS